MLSNDGSTNVSLKTEERKEALLREAGAIRAQYAAEQNHPSEASGEKLQQLRVRYKEIDVELSMLAEEKLTQEKGTTLLVADLPPKLHFLGTDHGDEKRTLTSFKSKEGNCVILAWGDESSAAHCCGTWKLNFSLISMPTDILLTTLSESSPCEFLIFDQDPDSISIPEETWSMSEIPQNRLVDIRSPDLPRQIVESVLKEGPLSPDIQEYIIKKIPSEPQSGVHAALQSAGEVIKEAAALSDIMIELDDIPDSLQGAWYAIELSLSSFDYCGVVYYSMVRLIRNYELENGPDFTNIQTLMAFINRTLVDDVAQIELILGKLDGASISQEDAGKFSDDNIIIKVIRLQQISPQLAVQLDLPEELICSLLSTVWPNWDGIEEHAKVHFEQQEQAIEIFEEWSKLGLKPLPNAFDLDEEIASNYIIRMDIIKQYDKKAAWIAFYQEAPHSAFLHAFAALVQRKLQESNLPIPSTDLLIEFLLKQCMYSFNLMVSELLNQSQIYKSSRVLFLRSGFWKGDWNIFAIAAQLGGGGIKAERQRFASSLCPPPNRCNSCGEGKFVFVDTTPNFLSVQWRCEYCERSVRVLTPVSAGRTAREKIPKEVQNEVWRRDCGKCCECGSQENLEFDHVIPVARGGANTTRNIQLLCQDCNRRKGASEPGLY